MGLNQNQSEVNNDPNKLDTPPEGQINTLVKTDGTIWGKFPDGNVRQLADDSTIRGSWQIGEDATITPPIITGNENDYAPAGLEESTLLRLSSTGTWDITGIQAPNPVRRKILLILNVGNFNIDLDNNNAASAPENRFLMNADERISRNEGAYLIYDTDDMRWRLISIYQ